MSGDLAAKIGRWSRRMGREISRLPVVSVVGDALSESSGVRELTARVNGKATDPLSCVQLVEALEKLEKRAKTVRQARAVYNPHGALIGAGLRKASQLGRSEDDRPQLRLCRRATLLSKALLRKNPGDARAVHALARVALLRERHADAVRLAKRAALLAQPTPGNELVTLARAYHGLRHLRSAERAAKMAIRADSTAGYDVLADLLSENEDLMPHVRIQRIRKLRERVREEDRTRYAGVHKRAGHVAWDVAERQREKYQETRSRLERFVEQSKVSFEQQLERFELGSPPWNGADQEQRHD
jgi:hypothetical protein